MPRPPVARAAALPLYAVVVALLLAGCSGTSSTGAPSGSSTTPSQPRSGSVRASSGPASSASSSVAATESAAAAIRRLGLQWYPLVDEAYQRLDGSKLRALSGADCGGCRRHQETIAGLRRKRERSLPFTVKVKIRDVNVITALDGTVDVEVTVSGWRIRDAKGRVRVAEPAQTFTNRFHVGQVNGRWVVLEIRDV